MSGDVNECPVLYVAIFEAVLLSLSPSFEQEHFYISFFATYMLILMNWWGLGVANKTRMRDTFFYLVCGLSFVNKLLQFNCSITEAN